MKYRNVEFVCSGNKGRSPLAEAEARKYLSKECLSDSVKLSSSGTLVDFFRNIDDEKLVQILRSNTQNLLEGGIIDRQEADEIMYGKRAIDTSRTVTHRLMENDERNRRIIVEERDLGAYLDFSKNPKQTVIRTKSELIFPMDGGNYRRVVDIYSSSDANPRIEPLGEIEDPLFTSLEGYRDIASQIERTTIEAIQKFL